MLKSSQPIGDDANLWMALSLTYNFVHYSLMYIYTNKKVSAKLIEEAFHQITLQVRKEEGWQGSDHWTKRLSILTKGCFPKMTCWGDMGKPCLCRMLLNICGNVMPHFCGCKTGDKGNPLLFQEENTDLHVSLFCHCCMDLNDEPEKKSEDPEVREGMREHSNTIGHLEFASILSIDCHSWVPLHNFQLRAHQSSINSRS